MPIERLLNPDPSPTRKVVKNKKPGKTKGRNNTTTNRVNSLVEDRPEKFDVVSAIYVSQTGMKFAQLWREDASGTIK